MSEEKEVVLDGELKERVAEAVASVLGEVSHANELRVTAEKNSLGAYYRSGIILNETTDGLDTPTRKAVEKEFQKAINMPPAFFYLSAQFATVFTDEQFQLAMDKGLTVRVMKAIVPIKDPKIRAKMIELAITKGVTDDMIRTMTTGERGNAGAPRGDKELPPIRIFTQTLDTGVKLTEMLGHTMDAVPRLADLAQEDVDESVKVLRSLVQQLEATSDSCAANADILKSEVLQDEEST